MTGAAQRSSGRLIALAAVVVLLLGLLVGLGRMAKHQAPPLAGTNGVGVGAVIATMPKRGSELCLARAPIPAGTGAVQLWLGWHGAQPVSVSGVLRLTGGASVPVQRTAIEASAGFATLPLGGVVGHDAYGQVCVTRGAGAGVLDVAGSTVIRAPGERPAAVDDTSLGTVEPSLRMLERDQRWSSSLGRVDDVIARLANLSPSPLGQFGIVVALFVLVPAAFGLLLWNLVTAPRRSRRRVAALCALGSLALTVSWATLTPSFQGPDEPEHFSFAQYLEQTGRHPDSRQGLPAAKAPYSTQLSATLAALRNNAVVIEATARQPWTSLTRDTIDATSRLPRDDGGGYTESASAHSAFYYVLLAPAIKLAGSSVEAQLWGARLTTALLAALVAGFAAWAAGTLVPGRPRLAALAGLAAATVPMAGAMGGVVNNDMFVALFAAAAFAAVLSLLVQPAGRWWRYAVAAATVTLIPIAKAAGFGVTIALGGAIAVAGTLVRPARQIPRAALSAAGGAIALLAVFALATVVLVDGQSLTLYNVHPVPFGPPIPGPPGPTFVDKLEYVAQTLVPPLHLGGTDYFLGTTPYQQVYLRGLWGSFGWNRLSPPTLYFSALQLAVVAGALAGFVALWRERARWRDRRLAVLAVAALPFIAIAFVAYAYASLGPRERYSEQGRYLLVALVPISLWFAAIPAAIPPGRWRSMATGALGGGLCVLSLVGLVSALGGWAA
ncbi:MAG: DUF2142 domain-containing protein [Solirubrobacteraceae bacterium]|nr:DUF2142 domain-containing protein [Solirubrobacteraceae bacterium]